MSDEKGFKSEWNEGDLHNLRIHKAKEMIAIGKTSPLQQLRIGKDVSIKYGYELWADGIDILFGDCFDNYSKEEYEEVNKLINEIFIFVNNNVFISRNERFGKINTTINNAKWYVLRDLLRKTEYLVRRYNNLHGYGTRNVDDDEEGL
jgi:hypothetical protein|tara:strand:+ start:5769 stop:6212 length:444 start_codon:yes stop_codon:yes gene_type:complete